MADAVVSVVTDANNFTYVIIGEVTLTAPQWNTRNGGVDLVKGQYYYTSTVAGGITPIAPAANQQIIGKALSTTVMLVTIGEVITVNSSLLPVTNTLSATSNVLQLSSLSVLGAGSYEIRYSLRTQSAGNQYFEVNADSTQGNYQQAWSRVNANATLSGSGTGPGTYIGSTSGSGDAFTGKFLVVIDVDGKVAWDSLGRQGAAGNDCIFTTAGRYNTVGDGTILGIRSDALISVGSYIKAIPRG
jgi:hypothetical protein